MPSAENDLDRALRLAADDPARRPDFYRTLMDSDVFVLGEIERRTFGVESLHMGDEVKIQNWVRSDGTPVIPFFSSLAALQRAIDTPASYLALRATSLFELTKGTTLVLNPKSDYGKEFLPDEVAALLSHGVNRLPEQRVTQFETQVLLGQPKEYPTQMIAALTSFLEKRTQVSAAFLALMHDPSHDQLPHLVVGIQADEEWEQILQEAGGVAADTAPSAQRVDLFRVVPGDAGLSKYFLESVEPFFRRS